MLEEPQLQLAFNVLLHRHMLLDLQNRCTWYLGERCVRQLHGVIAIPDDPLIELSYISCEDYFDHIITTMWPSIDRFYVEVLQQKYNQYLAQVYDVRLIPPI